MQEKHIRSPIYLSNSIGPILFYRIVSSAVLLSAFAESAKTLNNSFIS